MAKNKGAIVRYRTIDRCLRDTKRKYGVKELIEKCSAAVYETLGIEDPVSRSQIYTDLRYIQSDAGYGATIISHQNGRKVYYRYEDPDFSIEKMPLTDAEIDQLKETVLMLNRFKGMPHFEWMNEIISKLEDAFQLKGNTESVISFEQNPDLKGIENITPLFDAIVHKRVLKITYKSFKRETPSEYEMHPYFLKQYNNRWFLFGLTTHNNRITNLPLDRILDIAILDNAYIEKDEDFDIEEYFDEIIGVTFPKEEEKRKVANIVLKFHKDLYPYIKNKPFHYTQHSYDDECKITFKVIPNIELTSLILSYGSQVEVLEPQSLRDEIREHALKLKEIYN